MLRLFLLFTLLPVLELFLLVDVGGRIGALNTIGVCVLTGFLGAGLARREGAGVVQRIQAEVQRGGLPARELLDGALILVAGVVLLTPGFVTDAMGLALLFPPTRALVRLYVARRLQRGREGGAWQVHMRGPGPHGPFGYGGPTGDADPLGRREPPQRDGGGPDFQVLPPGSVMPPRAAAPPIIDVE